MDTRTTTSDLKTNSSRIKWIAEQGISIAFIEPGKPWQDGVAESFNGGFRDECLNMEWFRSRKEAKNGDAISMKRGLIQG
jgi:hypothetical protein